MVLRWPTTISHDANSLRAERSGPRHADSESKLSQRIQRRRQESRRAAPEP